MLHFSELKELAASSNWQALEKTIRPFLKIRTIEKEILELHRYARSQLARLCTLMIPGFDYLGTYSYRCGKIAHQVAEYEHRATRLDFVLLPPVGVSVPFEFWMGIPQEKQEHPSDVDYTRIRLNYPFLVCKTPITQEAWKRVMDENPSHFQKGDLYPVENVRWYDCIQFCERAELSLPTEAHWEYACRAGTQTAYCFGETLSPSEANYLHLEESPPVLGQTSPVGTYPHNAFGLYDVHGNVWECCIQWEGSFSERNSLSGGSAFFDGVQVFRGGSFSDGERYCRSGFRLKNTPDYYGPDMGLRPIKQL